MADYQMLRTVGCCFLLFVCSRVSGEVMYQLSTRMANDALTLTVFFEGTANRLSPITTQVGLFFQQCTALDMTDPQTACRESSSFKMGF